MVRLALVGSGDSAVQYERIARRVRNGQFTAIVARYTETARSTAQSVGADIWTDSFDELLADHATAFDAVVLQSPSRFQEQHVKRAADAGKHVLAEIPLALSKEAALEIISSCHDMGVFLMVAGTSRFSPSVLTAKESLDAGRLGEPGLVRIHSWKAAESGSGQQETRDTKRDNKTRLLLSGVVRELDLACWFFGRRPDLVYATDLGRSRSQSRCFDYVQLHLGFAGGGMALIDHSRTLPQEEIYFSISLIGSTGAVYADNHKNMQLLYGRGHASALNVGEGDIPLLMQLQEFVNSIEEDREPLVTGTDALRAIEVTEAAAVSLATRQAAQLETKGFEGNVGLTSS